MKTRNSGPKAEAAARQEARPEAATEAPPPTWAGVDLGALAWNARLLQRHAGARCRILAVVKADAYGHGAVEVSRRLREQGIDTLCVARPEEGIELRSAGIGGAILVLGPQHRAGLEACAASRLTPTLFDEAGLSTLEKIGRERGEKIGFHLKLDTGMGRLGLPLSAMVEFLHALEKSPRARLEGVCSHLSSVEAVRGETSRQQIERFRGALAVIEGAGHGGALKHLAASAALLDLPEAWFDAVRPGLALYGVHPSHGSSRLGLKPVMSVRTRVAAVREHPPGSPLGYEGTFVTRRRSRIAVLPIGYADGLPRALSNRGCVILGGNRAPIVGLVSMDLTLVDVTDVPAVEAGDEVTLFGDEDRGRPLEELASDAALSPYELLCGIGARVPRLYREGEQIVAERSRSLPQRRPAAPAGPGA